MAVKIRKSLAEPTVDGAAPSQAVPLPPLEVSGVCITKAALIRALRIYVPALIDIEVVEDGERYLLTMVAPAESGAGDGGSVPVP